MEWQKQGLNPPDAVIEATKAYHEEQDVLAGFFKTRCIFGEGENVWTPTGDLNDALKEWAREEGIDEKTLPAPNAFGARLTSMDCTVAVKKIDKKAKRCWSNVRLRRDDDELNFDGPMPNEKRKANTCEAIGQTVTPVTAVTSIPVTSPKLKSASLVREYTENGVTAVTGVTDTAVPDQHNPPVVKNVRGRI